MGAKRYAEKYYIRESAQTPSAEPLVTITIIPVKTI